MKKNRLLSNTEIASFCRQTALIIKAGITPAEGMEILMHDTVNKEGKELLEQISVSCKRGNPLFQALEDTGVFPDYVIKLISLGEESGNTDDVLISLAEYYEREENISESIKSAVTYPLIMIVMMFVVIIVLIVKVLPIFKQVFVQLGTQMSPLASSLLALGNTLSKYSLVITTIFFAVIVVFVFFYKTPGGRVKLQHFLTSFPLTKGFYEKVAAGRFASGMYLAFTSGMDTYRSLDMIADIVENEEMHRKIDLCKEEMRKDSDLPQALAKAEIFSNLYSRMVSVGFRSGSVDLVMKQIAKNYDDETQKQLNHIISIIEPTLVIVLSLIVGLILMSVLLPLMGIMSSIG
ncbi:MAG: type II secretion system F family protein [Suilimivivens sp.]